VLNKAHKNLLFIRGKKNSGKTTLIKSLIPLFTQRGYKVGTIKHSSHNHPLDKPDSDSDQFRKSGAVPSIFMTQGGLSIIHTETNIEKQIFTLKENLKNCDLVLVESFRAQNAEWEILVTENNLAVNDSNILAIVGSNIRHSKIPIFREPFDDLVDYIIKTLLKNKT
jgi:molybdopterin-guanine dinucleotide biosynthesis protein B